MEGRRTRLGAVLVATAILDLAFVGRAAAQPEEPEPPPVDPTDAPAPPAPPPVVEEPPEEPVPPPPEPVPPPEPAGPEAVADAPNEPAVEVGRDVNIDAGGEDVDGAAPKDEVAAGSFSFGSYGRVIAATDGRGGTGRDADIVAHGSRLDESNYVELELRRDDFWEKTGASTRLVATLAIAHPVFHYDGEFDIAMAVRNLYLEERDLGLEGLSVWAGSRMLRGDDIYLLDWWPLDNLNTLGAGVGYTLLERTRFAVHGGLSRPDTPFYHQEVERPAPLDQFGAAPVEVLDRQRFIGSLRAEHVLPLGTDGGGLKGVAYGEMHQLPSGQRETEDAGVFEDLPRDDGYVVGAQLSAFTGERDSHVNVFLRYATGLAAYGQFASPGQLTLEKTTDGAREVLFAAGGSYEFGPLGVMLAAYMRSFRDASPDLDYEDVDEGIVLLRPHVFFGEIVGLAVEGSFQAAQRGVIARVPDAFGDVDPLSAPQGPVTGRIFRFGIVPFLSPAGRGNFSRPQIRVIYAVSGRDEGARAFYPEDDVFRLRETEHFFGVGAEWWFNSSSYGG